MNTSFFFKVFYFILYLLAVSFLSLLPPSHRKCCVVHPKPLNDSVVKSVSAVSVVLLGAFEHP